LPSSLDLSALMEGRYALTNDPAGGNQPLLAGRHAMPYFPGPWRAIFVPCHRRTLILWPGPPSRTDPRGALHLRVVPMERRLSPREHSPSGPPNSMGPRGPAPPAPSSRWEESDAPCTREISPRSWRCFPTLSRSGGGGGLVLGNGGGEWGGDPRGTWRGDAGGAGARRHIVPCRCGPAALPRSI
jgi:hypothetical protein